MKASDMNQRTLLIMEILSEQPLPNKNRVPDGKDITDCFIYIIRSSAEVIHAIPNLYRDYAYSSLKRDLIVEVTAPTHRRRRFRTG